MPRDPNEPVRLTKIYTRGGDAGETSLGDGSRASKLDPRIRAYGMVDELNSHLGVALAGGVPEPLRPALERLQNELFDVGADLCTPVVEQPAYPPLRVTEEYVTRLETDCDTHNAELPTLRSFILPGGTPGGALLHVARTVVRRAERTTWAAFEVHDDMNPLTARYLNRLSDLLFILGRLANAERGDVLWRPGGDR